MPNDTNLISKVRQPLADVAYPAEAMILYVYGIHKKFAGVTKIRCHFGVGRMVC